MIEDDNAWRQGLSTLLRSEGYEVAAVPDLREAGAALAGPTPDLIIMDITLPDGDGASWLALIALELRALPPVIAVTGITDADELVRIRKSGARMVLHKPVRAAQLLLAIAEVRRA